MHNVELLGGTMGQRYAIIVRRCLKDDFGVTEDDDGLGVEPEKS